MADPLLASQGEGFIRRYLELDTEENRPGAEQALEWFAVIEQHLNHQKIRIHDLESRISQAKIALG